MLIIEVLAISCHV